MDHPIVSILYLDRFHLGDPLFLQALGRAVARSTTQGFRPLLVHGQGEYVQRRLEGEGLFLSAHRDVFTGETEVQRRLIGTIHRDLNRWLVGILTEAAVPAVGFLGSDRRMLTLEKGEVGVGRVNWLEDVVERGVVPVIGAAAKTESGEASAVDPVKVIRALAQHFGEKVEVVTFTTNNLGGVMRGRDSIPQMSLEDVHQQDVLPDPEGVEILVLAGARVLLTNTVRYPGGSDARGTWVLQEGAK